MSFSQQLKTMQWEAVKDSVYGKSAEDVHRALAVRRPTLEDFKALVSPAAEPYLELMARKSRSLTQQRFGKTVQFYVPLYLSNVCTNECTYCGFSVNNHVRRIVLKEAQILREAEAIKKMGFDSILLVTGEAKKVGYDYFLSTIELIKPFFNYVMIEVQPLAQGEYAGLMGVGLDAVMVYQETYNPVTYDQHHLKGQKKDFHYRLETADRIGRAGVNKIGLGALIGLDDWRTDCFHVAAHLDYLQRRYWRSRYSISFPRLRPCEGRLAPKSVMSDRQLLQLICAYRIWNQEVELSLSTRESEHFRDNVVSLGVTSMSAGSKTQPGGYADDDGPELEQFSVDDGRSPTTVADSVRRSGYEVVWKDWDNTYST